MQDISQYANWILFLIARRGTKKNVKLINYTHVLLRPEPLSEGELQKKYNNNHQTVISQVLLLLIGWRSNLVLAKIINAKNFSTRSVNTDPFLGFLDSLELYDVPCFYNHFMNSHSFVRVILRRV